MGMGAVPYVGLGDVTSDAENLAQDLTNSGCGSYQTANSLATAFQQSYNAANSGSPIGVDGLYGPQTQAALASTLKAAGSSMSAPAACVAGASSSSANSASALGLTGGTTTPDYTTYYIVGGVAAVGIGGYLLWRRGHKGKRR